jgi:RNA polymerase sigma-70 factor (ECF subfamily)
MTTEGEQKSGPTDAQLLEEIRAGSHAAFDQLVRRHHARYYQLAYRYLASTPEAEDVVQAAFLKLWEQPHLWQPDRGAQFMTWFYRLVVNQCLDRQKRQPVVRLGGDLQVDEHAVRDESLEQHDELLIQQQMQAQLSAEIAALPHRQKSALLLCVYEGKKHAEAAKMMQVNIKALRSLLARAKDRLKKNMQAYL